MRLSTVIQWAGPVAIVSGVFMMFSDLLGLTIYVPGLGEAANTGYQVVGAGVILIALTLLIVGMAGLYAGQPRPDGPRVIEIGYPLQESTETALERAMAEKPLRSAAQHTVLRSSRAHRTSAAYPASSGSQRRS